MKVAVARPGDSGIQLAADGHSVLFLSGRAIGQQISLADFDPETDPTKQIPKKLTNMATEAKNAQWSPDGALRGFHFRGVSRSGGTRRTTLTVETGCNSGRERPRLRTAR